MSTPRLPTELLDHIVDLLHDTRCALQNCCLVSKSWLPRTRRHLFASIEFDTEAYLESWKKTFPDPSTSPACYTTTLDVRCSHVVTAEDAEVGGWIRGFSRVVHLAVGNKLDSGDESKISFIPFYGLSPTVISLRTYFIDLPPPRVLDLALSFPLLEDLTVSSFFGPYPSDGDCSDGVSGDVCPVNSPVFTGSLKLSRGGVKRTARRLVSLPGGIHFRKLYLTQFHQEDLSMIKGLVKGCSHTLESLDVDCDLGTTLGPVSIDLSGASKLKDVTFRLNSRRVEWITATLQTITPKSRDLRQIAIHVPHYLTDVGSYVIQTAGERIPGQWLDLDRLLVQFWESRSIRPMVVRTMPGDERWDGEDCIGSLLPEITRREIIDLIE